MKNINIKKIKDNIYLIASFISTFVFIGAVAFSNWVLCVVCLIYITVFYMMFNNKSVEAEQNKILKEYLYQLRNDKRIVIEVDFDQKRKKVGSNEYSKK